MRIAEVCEAVSYDGPGWPYSIFPITWTFNSDLATARGSENA